MVLIFGIGGGVSLAALQLAKAIGAGAQLSGAQRTGVVTTFGEEDVSIPTPEPFLDDCIGQRRDSVGGDGFANSSDYLVIVVSHQSGSDVGVSGCCCHNSRA